MNKLFLIVGLSCIVVGSNAQDSDRITILKRAFIKNRLQLTPREEQKFWPLYNQYENEVQKAELRNDDALPKSKAILDIKQKYLSGFEKVIGQKKANELFNAERDFLGVLIHHLQNRNQIRPNRFRR